MNSGGREGLANGNGFRPHQRMVTPKMFKAQYKKSKTDIKTATGARILYKSATFAQLTAGFMNQLNVSRLWRYNNRTSYINKDERLK